MSRSGYTDEIDDHFTNWDLIRWRGRVASATRGARGQQFFRDLIAALDAMPVKELADYTLAAPEGPVCAMGEVARYRGVDLSPEQEELEDDAEEATAATSFKLDIAGCLAREVAYMNDDAGRHDETPAQRWARIRRWAEKQLNDD
jgi:hypothetical protein